MSGYHWALLAVAALGTLACVRACRGAERVEALAALGAMALAMSGAGPLLCAGVAVLGLLALRMGLRMGAGGALCLHRGASHLAMAAVLLALFVLNGVGICGDAALPLLTAEGVSLPPMTRAAELFVQGAALGLMAYLGLSLLLCWRETGRGRAGGLMEILPMTLATFGMAVRIG